MSRIRLLALTLFVTASPVPCQELATSAQRKTLASLCYQLARAGRAEPVREVYRCLKNLGMTKPELEALEKRCGKELARRRKPMAVTKRTIAGMKAFARELAERLSKLDEDARFDLAFEILAIDASVAKAHEALERKFVNGEWIDEDEVERRARAGTRFAKRSIGRTSSRLRSRFASTRTRSTSCSGSIGGSS